MRPLWKLLIADVYSHRSCSFKHIQIWNEKQNSYHIYLWDKGIMQCENHRETDKRSMIKKSNFFTYQPRPFQVRTSKNKPSLHLETSLQTVSLWIFLNTFRHAPPHAKDYYLTSIFLMKYLLKISSIFSCFIKQKPLNLVVPISCFKCIFFSFFG